MSFEQQLANNVANVSNFVKEAITQSQQVAEQYPGSQGIKTTALTCVQLTIKFKSIMQEATKPLFIHMPQIEKVCKVMITGLKKLADEVVSLSGNIWVGKVVENAIEATQNFSYWLVTNFETYLLTSVPEVNFLNAYPGDAQTVVQEMANAPLWLLHVLYDTRQATQVVEKKVLQSEVDLKTYQANMQEMFERQKLCFLNQQDSKSTELLQKIEHQEALITDLKYRAQEAKRSLLAGKKDEFAQIEAGQAKIEELTKVVADLEKRLKIADESVNERNKMINDIDAEKTVTAQQNQSLLKKVAALEDKFEKELASGFSHKVAPQAQALTQMTTVDVEKEKRLENNISQLKTQLASVQKENQHILLKMKSLQVQMAEKLKAAANKEGGEGTAESAATSTTPTATSTSVNKSGITWAQQIDTNAIVAPFFEQVSPIEVNYDSAMLWMSESDKHVCLAHLICNNIYDNAFVKLLGNVFVTGKAAENVVFAVLKIFEEQGRTMELIKRMIDQEVDNSDTSNQLFRGEDFPPRTIRAFTRIKGVQYLHFVLGSLIEEIIESDLCILMDNRFSGTNTNEYLPPDDNTIALANEWCQKFFDAILAARNCLPMEFYEIANYLSYKTSVKYSQVEGAVQGSVAGFIFLRFFCPCITSPLNFGFKKPAKGAQTTLLLIGKVIQSLANGVKSFKEESYANLNQFLTKNQSSLGQYYRHISSYPQRPYGDSLYHKILSHYINSELPKMNEKIVLVHPSKGDEFERVRTIPTHTIIEVAPLTQFESLLESIPKQPNIKIPNKDIKIVDRAKMPTSLTDPLVGAILQVFVENQNVSLAFIKVLLEKRNEASEWVLDNVKSLFTLFAHLNALDTLLIYVIVTEAGAVDSEKMFINDSITKLLFQQISYSPEVTEWLMSTCYDLLGAIKDVKPKDVDRIKDVFGIFLRQFFDSLAYAPKLIWMFCVALGEYSAINVFKFLLINLLSKLLEDPSSYRLDRDANIPTEHLSILTTMSDMVLTLANSDSDESATEAQAQAYELFNVFQAWIENPCDGVVEIPQEESMVWCETLNLTDALLLNIPEIKNQLKTLNKVVYNVHFFAKNLCSSFKPAPLPNTNDLSFSQFELEENIRKNRGTWNNSGEPVKIEGKEKGDKNLKLDSPSMKDKKGMKESDSPLDSPKTDRSKSDTTTTPRKNDSTVSSKFNIKNIGKK